jgi:hypothetical protein
MTEKWIDRTMEEDGQNFLTDQYVLGKCQQLLSAYLGELQDIGSIAPGHMNKPVNAINEAIAIVQGAKIV